ncbi:MAG: methyltransferase domain-containing protein [Anaerolineaceae bacterium]|nr:MAG: methyltransferase domain-containing protein [Anaerolineaceae bacterium]
MRRVVIQDDLREAQIRPDSGFNTYIELLERDLEVFLADTVLVELDVCPACGSPDAFPDFEKMRISYVRCGQCRTCYASPRPEMEALDQFYAESDAIQYWNSSVAERTASARKQYIFSPRATWVLETAGVHQQEDGLLVDFYTKYPVYLEELKTKGSFSRILIRKPAVSIDELVAVEGFEVANKIEEGTVSVVAAFEVIERLFDPLAFMQHIHRLLRPGGLVFLTTLSISGFDLSILRENARNLLPPTHLTLLSYEGIHRLIERGGFSLVEFSTPGQLDVALVLDALQRDPEIALPPVIDSALRRRGENVHEDLQDFLQKANLSSHVWIAAQKLAS